LKTKNPDMSSIYQGSMGAGALELTKKAMSVWNVLEYRHS